MKHFLDKSIFKGFRKDLAEKYGDAKATEIWNYAKEEYTSLIEMDKNADKQNKTFVFPVVALYRAVDHFVPEEALEVTRAYGTKTGLRFQKMFRKITALPGIPTLMWKNMDKIAAKMSDGYEVKDCQVDKEKCYMDISGCPLYDKAKALGTPEAVQMICCMDKEYMKGFRGIDYTRTKSVAEGDECCDYRLRKSNKSEKE